VLARRLRTLEERGWPPAEIRKRLAGIETAEAPGAAALTRLADLATLTPPAGRPERPPWCGTCNRETRMREHAEHDDRPYRCPECHPLSV
jgi:hypothetical protein